ncbi:MAG: GNAT family N-acetyltransferase [Flavipsychrobacter sp.]|nr:GNAT family N-acetyltransferase [Flavipsychrobacter sp.]
MAEMVIKPVLIEEEYGLISNMMAGLHANEQLLNPNTAPWSEIESAYMRHVIEMQNECAGVCLVAFVDEYPAGFIFGYLEEQDDSRIEVDTGDILYVSDGYVYHTYRRLGIYRKLNDALEQHFTADGVRRITRFTLAANVAMQHFLESEGYKVTRFLYEKWL